MFITITPRDVMHIILLGLACFVFIRYCWPWQIKSAINRNRKGGEIWGQRLPFFVLGWIILFYLALWLPDSQRSWVDAEPAISAVLITVAIFFGYGRFLPPTFYAAFLKVTDFNEGTYEEKRVDTLAIKRGECWPIFLVVHNTGIVTWDNYRITVDFEDDFRVNEASDNFPSSTQWACSPKPGSLSIGKPGYLQVKSTNVLTIGDTHAIRFFIKANKSGKFKIKVMVASAGRIGEHSQSLWLNVN